MLRLANMVGSINLWRKMWQHKRMLLRDCYILSAYSSRVSVLLSAHYCSNIIRDWNLQGFGPDPTQNPEMIRKCKERKSYQQYLRFVLGL